MSVQTWLRSPRRHAALFLAVTLVPSLLLVVLGWRLFEQDREGAVLQLEQRRGDAAALVVAELEQRLTAVAAALDDEDARAALEDRTTPSS
jgi:hypothetical protein